MTHRHRIAWALALSVGVPAVARAGKLETWRQDTAAAFAKGHKERVVVSDNGRVRLARSLKPTAALEADHAWALVQTEKGFTYAATGNAGKVYVRENDGPWTVAASTGDTQVLSLAALPDGRVFAGTGPTGQVIEVGAAAGAASRPDPQVRYIWGLAADRRGNLYAATGPTGQLWRRSPEGQWALLFDSKHAHLLCVAVSPDGSIYAGSDGEGLVYRVGPDGKVSVVYDAPQAELRSLLVAPDGAVYAGTAAEAGSAPGGPVPPGRGLASTADLGGPPRSEVLRAAAPPQVPGGARPELTPGGTAAPRPVVPGDNAVYRIGRDGAAREVFRARAMVHTLAAHGDRLFVGTGPEGQLYEVRDLGRETVPLARLDHGQILALLTDAHGDLLIGTGDPGGVLRLAAGHATAGTLTSDVLDAKLPSRFGALVCQGDQPPGTSIAVHVRSGNVGEPDATWSSWSAAQPGAGSSSAPVPPGRFAQYRFTLKTNDPSVSPEVRSVTLHYQTLNLAPELTRIDVPDLREADGSVRQVRLQLKWDASDPNGDDLAFTLHVRKDGWPDWVQLGPEQLTDKAYAWDTTAMPAGSYRLRLTATDRPSNPPGDALVRELTSEPFVVDHQAPTVTVTPKGRGAAVTLKDDLTRLVKAAYAVDGGEWVAAFPTDDLFDTTNETITINLPDLKSGMHVLMVRATDAAGNVGSGDAVLVVP
jgi:hypothetical protein